MSCWRCGVKAHLVYDLPRTVKRGDNMRESYLGCEFTTEEIKLRLSAIGAVFEEHSQADMLSHAANALVEQHVVGCFQGRMEFGPRSLGSL
jgi:carbamoyltransferase